MTAVVCDVMLCCTVDRPLMMHYTQYFSQKCMPIKECEAENMYNGLNNRNINILPDRQAAIKATDNYHIGVLYSGI
jgi:hypothetical protein